MCGIAGVVRSDRPIHAPAQLIDRLDAALAHRGPDGRGHWLSADARALLVHRRLAIIDLSADAAQPMPTSDGRHHLAFNGEIYNYRDIRRSLEARGEVFTTSSDPAGILAYLEWGTVPPSLTWIDGVESLTPGTWLRATADRRVERRTFADVRAVYARTPSLRSESELRARVGQAVQDSVAAHLVA